MAREDRTHGEGHLITVEPTGAPVTVRIGDRVIAQSASALTLREAHLWPVQYVPLADVDAGVLRRSESTTYCPYKGTAAYYDLVLAQDEELTDAVWTYEEPYPGVAALAGHVAFYPGRVEVTAQG